MPGSTMQSPDVIDVITLPNGMKWIELPQYFHDVSVWDDVRDVYEQESGSLFLI